MRLLFTEHLLDSLSVGARCIIIVPQSTMTGKSRRNSNQKKIYLNIIRWREL